MKTKAMTAFYEQLESVLRNLSSMFPEDPDFPTFRFFLSGLKMGNPLLPIKTFHENVSKYEHVILARDEAFLLAYNGDNVDFDILAKFQTYWGTFDAETKASLWQYLFILNECAKRAL